MRLKLHKQWAGLLEVRGQIQAQDDLEYRELLDEYREGEEKLFHLKSKLQMRQREAVYRVPAAKPKQAVINVSGLTTRGPPLHTFRGDSSVQEISVGGHHVVAIHSTGKLYSWGIGISGRLGRGKESKLSDEPTPTLVDPVKDVNFKQVSCGFSHSAAIATSGKLYIWGSASTGKLGVMKTDVTDCYANTPTILQFPDKARIRSVSCGSGHTAAVTTRGKLVG